MSIENLFSCSIDSDIINHYLQLLAARQVNLENQVVRLTAALQQRHSQAAELALLDGNDACEPPGIVNWALHPELTTQLLAVIPAIFPGFWNTVSPGELAILIGVTEKPVIPSPYSYPENKAIVSAVQQMQSLAKAEQFAIHTVCCRLQQRYRLLAHPLWQTWLQDRRLINSLQIDSGLDKSPSDTLCES